MSFENDNDDEFDDSPYASYRMTRAQIKEVNDSAKKIMIDMHGATELEIFPILLKYAEAYPSLVAEFLATPRGKITDIKKRLAEQEDILKIAINKGVYKSREVTLFTEYIEAVKIINNIDYGAALEDKVDGLYRQEDAIRRLIQIGAMSDPKQKIVIKPGLNIEVDTLSICRIDREILVERGKHYIKNMSKEKAQRFLSSAKKRLAEKAIEIERTRENIEYLKEQLQEAQVEQETDEGKTTWKTYLGTKKEFETKLCHDLEKRLNTYIDKHDETPIKSKIRYSLRKAQDLEIEKKHENTALISPATLIALVCDIYKGNIKLPDYTYNNGTEME